MAKKITVRTWTKWNGTEFPISDRQNLDRLSRYPVSALSRRALFAVAMTDYADTVNGRTLGRSKRLTAMDGEEN